MSRRAIAPDGLRALWTLKALREKEVKDRDCALRMAIIAERFGSAIYGRLDESTVSAKSGKNRPKGSA